MKNLRLPDRWCNPFLDKYQSTKVVWIYTDYVLKRNRVQTQTYFERLELSEVVST